MPEESLPAQPGAAPTPAASASATAPAPAPAAKPAPVGPPAKPVELAPEGVDCPHCGQRMRVYSRYAKNIEFCCPSLKEDPPVLADKYAEWRDLYLKSRVSKPL